MRNIQKIVAIREKLRYYKIDRLTAFALLRFYEKDLVL